MSIVSSPGESGHMPGLECISDANLRAFLLGDLPERVARSIVIPPGNLSGVRGSTPGGWMD